MPPVGPPTIVLSVEADCKAVPANGSDSPYRVALGLRADPAIEGAAPSFVDYLRSSLRWGGFARLSKLEPLVPKAKAIARKKRRSLDEWQLVFAEQLRAGRLPF